MIKFLLHIILIALSLNSGLIASDTTAIKQEYIELAEHHKKNNNLEKAASYYRQALRLDPDNYSLHFSLATMFAQAKEYEKALEEYNKINATRPHIPQVLYNSGYCLKSLGRFEEAIEFFDALIEVDPKHSDAHQGRAHAKLALGNYSQAWPDFEHRWSQPRPDSKNFVEYIHAQKDLTNRKVLLRAEFGLGDTLQFIRYAQLLKNQGAYIILESQKALIPLLSLCPFIDEIVPVDTKLPPHHLATALMSTPWGFKTTLSTIPQNIPYLKADTKLVEEWANKLAHDSHFKIGICWHGNDYDTQVLKDLVNAKSIPLKLLRPLSLLKNVSLYSLQKTSGQDQLKNLPADFKIHQFDATFDEDHGRFMDTAAVMKNLDLIITIDTSIAHLAGGLGVPVFLLVPQVADWRWLTKGEKSAWYPTMKLFRQSFQGDWQPVVTALTQAVAKLAESPVPKTKLQPSSVDPQTKVQNNDTFEGLVNKGMKAYNAGNLPDAGNYFDAACHLDPENSVALYNAASIQRRLCNMDKSIILFNTLLDKNPDHHDGAFGLAQAYLASGEIEKGWQLFNRWRKPEVMARIPTKIEDIADKKIVITAEWGLGDMIHFIRYTRDLKKYKAHVIVQVHPSLTTIIKSCPWIDQVVSMQEKLPEADYYIPLLYLPTLFATKATSTPAQIPYLQAPPEIINHWQKKLANDKNFKIGICWDIGHHDTNFIQWQRSAPLKHWLSLAKIPGISFYSLQKNGHQACKEIESLMKINDLGPDFDITHGGFMDSAALMKCLDLVITVDTAIAHLAGALGVPTWTLLPTAPDYRWTLKGMTTPWYPTMLLFRQKNAGDWDMVMHEIKTALEKFLQATISNKAQPISSGMAPQKTSMNTAQSKNETPQEINPAQLMQTAYSLYKEQKIDEAIAIYQQITTLKPDITNAHINLGHLYNQTRKIDGAIAAFEKGLALNPQLGQIYGILGDLYCTKGDLEKGWNYWRTRFTYIDDPPQKSQPMWRGEPLKGKTIVIEDGGGFGDLFQWIRFTRLFKAHGAQVIVEARPEIIPLLSSCQYIDALIPKGAKLPNYDMYIPLERIHLTFNLNLDTIPKDDIPYIFADKNLVQEWQSKLAHDKKFKVGVCLTGNIFIDSDTKKPFLDSRSMTRSALSPLSAADNLSLYSLERSQNKNKLSSIDQSLAIKTFDTEIDTVHGRFMDTAAIIKNLDLVITIDTSIAHLAGALGVPVWVMLPHNSNWRWFIDRADSPWYPTMRLFRQKNAGNWHSVIEEIAQELPKFIDISEDSKKLNKGISFLQALEINSIDLINSLYSNKS